MADSAAWDAFCAQMDALDDEQCLTFYFQTYDMAFKLRHKLTNAGRPFLQVAKITKLRLLEAFAAGAPPCVQIKPDVHVKLALRQVTGKDINIATLAAAVETLNIKEASDQLLAQQQDKYKAWLETQTKLAAPPRARKNARPSLKRKAEPEEVAAAAAAAASAPVPPEPEVKYVGKYRVPTRKELSLARTPSTRELLAQVVYNSVHGFHKPRKPTVSVLKRVPASKCTALDALPSPVQTVFHEFIEAQVELKKFRASVEAERARRFKLRRACTYLQPRLITYISGAGGKQSRTVSLDDGDRTFTLQVTSRTIAVRTLTLWETSELIDALVMERFPDCAWDASACPVAFDSAFVAELQSRVQATLDERTQVVDGLRVYRGRVHDGTRRGTDADADDDADADYDDADDGTDADPDAEADDAGLASELEAKLLETVSAAAVADLDDI